MKQTEQIKFWQGEFGKEYTSRNTLSQKEFEEMYFKFWGVHRKTIDEVFFGGLDRNLRILEVGCNVGQQLRNLESIGFKNLFGIDVQEKPVAQANAISANIKASVGSLLEIPHNDKSFDLVFTAGVLIHIDPKDIPAALKEIYRCSGRYIWGMEYFSKTPQDILYRGHAGFLWKRDFCGAFQEMFPDLKLLKELRLKDLESDNIDQIYLLEKTGAR